MEIRRVGHIGLYTRDLDAGLRWYQEILGLEVTERAGGAAYLSCDATHHGLILYEGDPPGAHHFGFEAPDERAVERAAQELRSAGVEPVEVAVPGQGRTIAFQDPEGYSVWIYCGMRRRYDGTRFPVWAPRKFGHITAKVTDIHEQVEFYGKVLGFRVSDWMTSVMVWMRCSPDHHGVAWIQADRASLHHLAWEVQDWSALRALADHMLNQGVRLMYGPGRHGPGFNLFLYVRSPDGILNELFADMLQIWNDDEYTPRVWEDRPETINQWGPAPPPEFLE
jgi:catechol 2,3-dioxygenase-like lactoylglutathione lyase family enzyme